MSEIRRNLLTGEWVIIAPERAKRPTNLGRLREAAPIPERSTTCPFCPGNETLATDERFRLENGSAWSIRSVVNKFSVLGSAAEAASQTMNGPGAGASDASARGGLDGGGNGISSGAADVIANGAEHRVAGLGLHEVIIEHPRHDLNPAIYPREHLESLLEAYRHRFLAFSANPLVKHVILFKNHGEEAGASQQHPHSQIVGLPIVPGQVAERIERARAHHRETGECLACRMIARELAEKARIIDENEAFVAFIPFAALSPYHLWIFPKRHSACFAESVAEGAGKLAEVLHQVLGRVFTALGNPAYNLVVRSLGPGDEAADAFHWYLSIVPRVGKMAGFELGTGMFVNPGSPEASAATLRAGPLPPAVG